MILPSTDIKWLHVEVSSKCNAWCPACPRNSSGFGLAEGVVEQDLLPSRFEEVISGLPGLEAVQLCGNLGDPIASVHINDILSIAKKYTKKVQIHTNGSLRNTVWWKDFAEQLSDVDHDVWFGIDGLSGVHEIYRQGTNFEKVIENAQAFINAGGHATWQFIPYKHNEHQAKECYKLSHKIGFKQFKLAKLYRNQTVARHYKTGLEFDLLPTDSLRQIIPIDKNKTTVVPKNCMHLSMPSIYLSANGKLSRCCYMFKREKFNSTDDLLSNSVNDLTDHLCVENCG